MQELNRRSYQVLSTLYHLSRFFLENSEFDNFKPTTTSLTSCALEAPDRWLLSKLQGAITGYTDKLSTCEFNAAVAILEDFVIETLSRLYVPMIRKELWTDDPKTLARRVDIYSVLHYTLKTVTLLFNPVTPYLSEALYQKVYRKLDKNLPESVNFDEWPNPDNKLIDKSAEEEFDVLFKAVSLVYAARQQAKLKRRWPLKTVVVVGPGRITATLKKVESILLELSNVKKAQYAQDMPEYTKGSEWVSAIESEISIVISGQRDEKLLGEGIMRDLARRVQALRKELGYLPSDVLDGVHIAGLDAESSKLVENYLIEMAELVRTRKVNLHLEVAEVADADWREAELDGKKISISIH